MKGFLISCLILSSVSSFATTMSDDQKIEIINEIVHRELPAEGIHRHKIKSIDLELPYRYAVPLFGQAAAVVDHISFADDVDVDIAKIELSSDESTYLLTCKAVSSRTEVEDHEEEGLYSYSMALKKCALADTSSEEVRKIKRNFTKKWDHHL